MAAGLAELTSAISWKELDVTALAAHRMRMFPPASRSLPQRVRRTWCLASHSMATEVSHGWRNE